MTIVQTQLYLFSHEVQQGQTKRYTSQCSQAVLFIKCGYWDNFVTMV